MANERIQQLRELLLQLFRGPVDSMAGMFRGDTAAMFDEALPEIVRLRFDGDVPELIEEHKLATISVLRAAVALEGAGSAGTVWGGPGFAWDDALGIVRRNKAAAFGAALAVVVAILLIVFGQSWFAAQPLVDDSEKSAPEVVVPEGVQPEELPEIVPDDEGRTEPDEPGLLAVLPKRVGEIFTVVGRPSLSGPGAEDGETALPNMPVYAGMTLETGDADMLEIQFEDGSSLALAYNARITITDLPEGSGVPEARRFRLASGKVSAKVARLEGGATFEIETPVATAVALGTEFKLELRKVADPDDGEELEAVLTVSSGHVRFENEHGSVDAFAMMESIARADGRPSEPRRIVVVRRIRLSDSMTITRFSGGQPGWRHVGSSLAQSKGTVGLAFGSALASDPLIPPGPDDVWRVQITRVARGSVAQVAGLKVGDVVLRVDGRPVVTVDDARIPLYAAPGTETVLTVTRAGAEHTVTLTSEPEPPGRAPSLAESEMEKLRAATILGIQGDFSGSVAALTALTDGPEPAAAHNNLGVLYLVRDELGDAIRHFQAAVKLAPDVGLYRSGLAWALVSIRNYSRALEEMEAAAALAPDWAGCVRQLSYTYDTTGNHTKALTAAERLAALTPNDARAFYRLGDELHHLQRYEESERAFKKAIDLEPDYALGYGGLGQLYYSIGKFAESDELYRTAIRLDPTEGYFPHNLAAHLQTRDIEEAYALTKTALRLRPDQPLYLLVAGRIQRRRGNFEDAIRLFENALESLKFAQADSLRISITLNIAIALAKKGDIDEAETMYLKAIKLDPTAAISHNDFAIFLKDTGRLEEAEKEYRKAIELDPGYAGAHNRLGNLLKNSGRLEEAEAMYRRAIELNPGYVNALTNFGTLLSETGRLREAETMLRKAIELDPEDVAAHNNLGNLFFRAGRLQEAEAMYHKAIELDPKSSKAHHNLGFILERAGRLEEAEAMYRKVIELDPEDAGAHRVLGNLLERVGRVEEAEAMYRKAIELDPGYAKAHLDLGVLFYRAGRFEEAETKFRKAIELEPKMTLNYRNLATVLSRLGRVEEAIDVLRKAIELDPKYAYAHYFLGNLLYRVGRVEEAEAMYRKVIEIDPKYVNAYRNLVAILTEQGRLGEIEDVYRQWLAALPDDLSASNDLAWFFAEQGESLDEALVLARRAVEGDGENPYFIDTLGWVHFKRGEHAEAEAALRKAVELFGANRLAAESLFHLGQVYEAKGDREAAKDAYRRALSIEPSNKEAAEALKRLGGQSDSSLRTRMYSYR
ncbi:MAG: tetratricopeptide repeat protein [Armatimonadetes bacterium]|nr:tetratricopeptide repeat protein [Armatimonadota bacterium]